jgi:uncharacterized membrane protein YfcA
VLVVLSATVVFALLTRPVWLYAAIMTPTSITGGAIGAWAASRMPKLLRLVVVAVGGFTIVHSLI